MGSIEVARNVARQVRPILSTDRAEARRRVLALYKSWYRAIPEIVLNSKIPKSEEQCRQKLREEFLRNKNVKDLRVIDVLIVKGQGDLHDSIRRFKQKTHLMVYWKDTIEPKPTDFLSKFIQGHE